ncbi:hypothetical protein EYF80_024379 [Liparis tanakae]|uniref:Uncharacterized protein n=1 Tax=Liparis tanakae TaxID=230148 RepID=A0A4Z2HHX4_9TELE|nr:hypothetical protein EYF80_024379 [Liparis tanakae]
MARRRVNNPFILLERMSEQPTWGERSAVGATDWQFADEIEAPESTMESEWEDLILIPCITLVDAPASSADQV